MRITEAWYVAKADLYDRIRTNRMGIVICAILGVSYIFIPPRGAGIGGMSFGGYGGVYNSAWTGSVVALLSSVFLSLIGFYMIKNSVLRDYNNHTEDIVYSSPIKNFTFLSGKALSNLIFLLIITVLMAVAALIMQFIRQEDSTIQLFKLLTPFVVFTFPALCFISSIGVLFETLPILRGTVGNFIYFILWIVLLSIGIQGSSNLDVTGTMYFVQTIQQFCYNTYSDYKGAFVVFGTVGDLKLFVWDDIQISTPYLLSRLGVILSSILIVYIASLYRKPVDKSFELDLKHTLFNKGPDPSSNLATNPINPVGSTVTARGAPRILSNVSLPVWLEIKALVKGTRPVYYFTWFSLILLGLFFPTNHILISLLYIWPMFIISPAGCKDYQLNTYEYFCINVHYTYRKTALALAACTLLLMFTLSGVILSSMELTPLSDGLGYY